VAGNRSERGQTGAALKFFVEAM